MSILIDGFSYHAPAAGDFVKLDCNRISRQLVAWESDIADLGLECHSGGPIRSVACRVEVTGRKVDFRDNSVRCRVVFVGDGEPDKVASGKLFLRWA
jgi:hypothetical protein